MKRTVVLPIAAVLLAACAESPVQPGGAANTISPESASLNLAAADSASAAATGNGDFRRIIADVLPGFADADAARQLEGHLLAIDAAVTAGDDAEALRLLGLARALLTPEVVNDGDRGYVEMVFRDLDAALQQ